MRVARVRRTYRKNLQEYEMRSSDEATAQIWLAVRLFDSYEWLDDETSTLPQACDILAPK